ncbi:hypothetical protein ACIF6L_34355 [Kitasatospora sp. NPDC086009]|uniref:hypothetical protein n=1 Tax=unclassified Kitasatospora TaxID=2633591 RepID=UPI0037CC8979
MTPGLPASLVCPDCSVWRRINRGRIQPHFLDDETTYCQASARRVEKDVTPEKWALAIAEGVADTAARRPTTVLRKIPTPKPKALHQLSPAEPTADTAGARYGLHRNGCSTCTDTKHCIDGGRLAAAYLQLLRQEPERRAAQARTEQEQRRAERREAEQLPRRRMKEWSERLPAVQHTDMVRRMAMLAGPGDTRRRVMGPDLLTETDRRERAQALAKKHAAA